MIIAGVLLYVAFGMTTTIIIAFIRSVAGDVMTPRVLLGSFALWPVIMCALFAAALEGEL